LCRHLKIQLMEQFLKVTIPANHEQQEILIAELSMIGYAGFQEFDEVLEAYVELSSFDEKLLDALLKKYKVPDKVRIEQLENINWNEQWEQAYDPVFIDGKVQIRASFHKPLPQYELDIKINPKMSFGTGHHATTQLIISELLATKLHKKAVLDVGTGTGVLAIVAGKLGAASLTVTDIDDWSIQNCAENFLLNGLTEVEVLRGTISKLAFSRSFDIIIANINKNVLLDEMHCYAEALAKGGLLMLSGFYTHDVPEITKKAESFNLKVKKEKVLNSWAVLCVMHATT
jgi:ribosomal protein L11 methyltransferase